MSRNSLPAALLVNHRGERCGVFQFGERLRSVLAIGPSPRWEYAECADQEEYTEAFERHQPDIVLFNHHPVVMPWAPQAAASTGVLRAAVLHEVSNEAIIQFETSPFDFALCPDPTLTWRVPNIKPVPRFIAATSVPPSPPPELFTVGSFGFATPGKGFDRLCGIVNDQFDVAQIRINLPPHDRPDIGGVSEVAGIIAACRARITKPDVNLSITQDFMNEGELLAFLAGNTINAFLYEDLPGRGIASVIDYALAVERPIAVSRSSMFRHLHGLNPSILIEDRTLQRIAASGDAPLAEARRLFSPEVAGLAWNDAILAALKSEALSFSTPGNGGFNRQLDKNAKQDYSRRLDEMKQLGPQHEADSPNLRHAFMFDAIERLSREFVSPRILFAGEEQDATVLALRARDFAVETASLEADLDELYRRGRRIGYYNLIACPLSLDAGAIVQSQIRMVGELLQPGGVAVFTLSRVGQDSDPIAIEALKYDLFQELPDCELADTPNWSSEVQSLNIGGVATAITTWTVRRRPANSTANPSLVGTAPHWVTLLGASEQRAADWQTELTGMLARRDRAIGLLRRGLRRRGESLALARASAARHERHAKEQTDLLSRAERAVSSLQSRLDDQRSTAGVLAADVHNLQRRLAHQDRRYTELSSIIGETRQAHDRQMRELEAEVAVLTNTVQAMRQSRSWRMTGPVRGLSGWLRSLRSR